MARKQARRITATQAFFLGVFLALMLLSVGALMGVFLYWTWSVMPWVMGVLITILFFGLYGVLAVSTQRFWQEVR